MLQKAAVLLIIIAVPLLVIACESEEEVIAYIDEIEAEEEARIELADMAREGWR